MLAYLHPKQYLFDFKLQWSKKKKWKSRWHCTWRINISLPSAQSFFFFRGKSRWCLLVSPRFFFIVFLQTLQVTLCLQPPFHFEMATAFPAPYDDWIHRVLIVSPVIAMRTGMASFVVEFNSPTKCFYIGVPFHLTTMTSPHIVHTHSSASCDLTPFGLRPWHSGHLTKSLSSPKNVPATWVQMTTHCAYIYPPR